MYPPHHLGGYELVWQAAVRALRAAGHEVTVLTTIERFSSGEGKPEDPGVHRELQWYWRDHEFPRLSPGQRLALERHNHRVLGRHLDALSPDVVSWWAMGGMSQSLIERVRRSRLPAIGWVNDDWLVYGPLVDQWLKLWKVPGRIVPAVGGIPTRVDLRRQTRWVFCSEVVRSAADRARGGLEDTAVCHQGVSPDFTFVEPQPWQGRLLYAGRIDERKGIGTLIDAVAKVPEVTLRVIGDGDAEELARLRGRAGERVRFDPGVSRAELAAAYAAADAVVFPVEWGEPWGLVPLEAMAVGRPVVATGTGGSAEYLADGDNAALFRPGDVDGLRARIAELAASPSLRERLHAGGRETASRLTEARWTAAVVREHEALGG